MTDTLNDLLRATSRSFYLTLRVLPAAVRPQIGLAYLLARTTDTIADTELVPVAQRLEALAALRARILGNGDLPMSFGELAQQQGEPAERTLLEQVEHSLVMLRHLSAADLVLVRQVINTITSGQELDLKRFGEETNELVETLALTPALSPGERENLPQFSIKRTHSESSQRGNERHPLQGERAEVRADHYTQIIALQTEADLDDYTYRVAGCVGEFWTRMCRAHLYPDAKLDDDQLLADSVRFGKGLQLVNILRDLPHDLQQGRCYVPADLLAANGLRPPDLLNPATEARFRPLYNTLLDRAAAHLAAGWEYTNRVPPGQWRVRLACAWPILIGVRTIELLRTGNVLDATRRVKVSRNEVRDLMLQTVIHLPFPGKFCSLWTAKI